MRRSAAKYFSDVHDFSQTDREKAILILEVLQIPIRAFVESFAHEAFLAEFAVIYRGVLTKRPVSTRGLGRQLRDSGYLADSIDSTVRLAERLIPILHFMKPLLAEWDPEAEKQEILPSLRVPDISQFVDLGSVYVDAFEALSRGLTIGVALCNFKERSSLDAMAPSAYLSKLAAGNLAAFHSYAHGPKLRYLTEYPLLHRRLSSALNSRLRNAFGHNAARIDFPTQRIAYGSGQQRTGISMAQFGALVMTCMIRLIEMNSVAVMLWPEAF
jgi:hypothetical protein